MQDAIRPNEEAFKRVYAAGYQTWLGLYNSAIAIATPLEVSHSNMADAFPSHPYLLPQLELDRSSTSILEVTRSTSWKTTNSKCNLPSFTMKTALRVTAPCPTRVILEDSCSATNWTQFGDHGDHIPILTLAWAYVLSARWAETIPEATLEYTGSRAPLSLTGEMPRSDTAVHLNDMTDGALRWWEAILAADEGWNASVPSEWQKSQVPMVGEPLNA